MGVVRLPVVQAIQMKSKRKTKPVLWIVDGLPMDGGWLIEAAREYGYGGDDSVGAATVLRRWGYKVRRKR